ncbi:MAG: hypothetical protein D9V47_09210 [Clostridia bacterium]|nr:MAG: hypothetical protein D9V47_09210 [Clostridia bacterium]
MFRRSKSYQGQEDTDKLLVVLRDMQHEITKRGLKDGGYGALELVLRCFIEVVEKGNPKLPDYSFEYIWSTLPKSLCNLDE